MQIHCSFCDGLLEAEAEQLGSNVSCPHCLQQFQFHTGLLPEEEEAESAPVGSWLSRSMSIIVSTATHTAILVICALVTCNLQRSGGPGEEVILGELPVQQTLTPAVQEQLDVEQTETETLSDSPDEIEVQVITPTESGGSGDLSDTIEALTSSGVSGSGLTNLDNVGIGSGSRNVAATGEGDAFAAKLKAAGAKTGDVQISLEWFNGNDLDLWVICPSGEKIFYQHRASACRGKLDIDMNAGGPDTLTPIENVFWPKRGAPRGQYRVLVHHYRSNGFPDPSKFTVRINRGGRPKDFKGAVSRGQPAQLVETFNYRRRR